MVVGLIGLITKIVAQIVYIKYIYRCYSGEINNDNFDIYYLFYYPISDLIIIWCVLYYISYDNSSMNDDLLLFNHSTDNTDNQSSSITPVQSFLSENIKANSYMVQPMSFSYENSSKYNYNAVFAVTISKAKNTFKYYKLLLYIIDTDRNEIKLSTSTEFLPYTNGFLRFAMALKYTFLQYQIVYIIIFRILKNHYLNQNLKLIILH